MTMRNERFFTVRKRIFYFIACCDDFIPRLLRTTSQKSKKVEKPCFKLSINQQLYGVNKSLSLFLKILIFRIFIAKKQEK